MVDDFAYGSWRDGGLTILVVKDKSAPKLIAHRNWCPPYGGGTHNAVPLHDRGLLVVADEAVLNVDVEGQLKRTWVFDIREKSNPVSIATMPTPSDQDYVKMGGQFGPHNLHENRPGSFQSSTTIFATWQSAGLRVFDISDAYPPAGGRLFRAAAAGEMGGADARTREDAAYRRSVRGAGRAGVSHRLRWRIVYRAVEGGDDDKPSADWATPAGRRL